MGVKLCTVEMHTATLAGKMRGKDINLIPGWVTFHTLSTIDRFHVTSSLSKIHQSFILIMYSKRRNILNCLQFYSSIACFVWKPEYFESLGYGDAWLKALSNVRALGKVPLLQRLPVTRALQQFFPISKTKFWWTSVKCFHVSMTIVVFISLQFHAHVWSSLDQV